MKNKSNSGKSGTEKGKKRSKTPKGLGTSEITKHCQVWIRKYQPSLFGSYFVIGIQDDRVLLARHYISENWKHEEFSQLGEPFIVNKNQCILMYAEPPRNKGVGGLEWLLTDYARSMFKDKKKPYLETIQVSCSLQD